MRHYCTYFDHNYLARGLALFRSLRRHSSEPFHLWILALNDETERILGELDLPSVTIIPLPSVEGAFPKLKTAKTNRSLVEYFFTLTPCLPLFVFVRCPWVDQLTYLDADIWFFSDPTPVFSQIDDASITVTPHAFTPDALKTLEGAPTSGGEKYGRFNVGWVTFTHDAEALSCLRRWQQQCIEWCHDRPESGKYGDQAYLDEWPELYPGLRVLEHPGVNAAIWNVGERRIERGPRGGVFLDGAPLVAYHFHGLKAIAPRVYDSMMRHFGVRLSKVLNTEVYAPYLESWLTAEAGLERHATLKASGFLRNALSANSLPRRIARWLGRAGTMLLRGQRGERMRCWMDWASARIEAICGQHFVVREDGGLRVPWRV